MKTIKCWIEAMRLRTLPVSLAGIAWAAGIGVTQERAAVMPLVMCLLFALLAQIASNFANEYFDYRDGLDRPGREGFRRGVTEGDISPAAMFRATMATLLIACCIGLLLVALYGRWWMYVVGAVTALGVVAYSAGPYPLSRHGLGEVAVIGFFGIVPVTLTVVLEGASVDYTVWMAAVGVGLMGANVLLVNNYRDCDDDAAVGKATLAVKFGRSTAARLYCVGGLAAMLATLPAWRRLPDLCLIFPAVYLVAHQMLSRALLMRAGSRLNPLLGMTAMLMFAYSLTYLASSIICYLF